MIGKRRLLAATAGLLMAGSAGAQPKYPSEPVKLIVPRAPGGGSDILARLLQPALEKKLGVPVIVDNRPDAAAVMGATIVTKAKPDGHTLLLTDNSFYQNPAILDSLPYDTLNGFTAITMLAQAPVILIVHPDVPAKTLAELLALAKKTNLTFASGGVGSSTHLMGVMVNLKAGTSITHVPFKSSGQA
ncbi:MAG TPA: tripartite tricarboxylate transporter substrate-binding protein, partial [Reyranella sp.]|nr:tripartite tricarboxylate transporter substrate-binding protein [Reyranella sp.]